MTYGLEYWNFIENLGRLLEIKFDIKLTIQFQNNKYNKSSVARIRKIDYIKKFGDYIYSGVDIDKIGFTRKLLKYRNIIKLFANDGRAMV
jgi:hypothetical protein